MTVLPGVAPATTGLGPARVARASRAGWAGGAALLVLLAVLAAGPYLFDRGVQVKLTLLLTYVLLATMWNLLAGYGGLISIGQQAFIGIGGYGLIYAADTVGVNPFLAVPVAAALCGAVAWVSSFLLFRLAGGYFAIGTWVFAEVVRLLTTQVDALGAGSGTSLRAYAGVEPVYRVAYVYWLSLAAVVLSVVGVYLLMRSRTGLALTAVRDEPTAAGSLGIQVVRARRVVWVAAGAGSGVVGALLASSALRVQPDSIYSVNYTAFAIFMVVLGGIGTIEGPVLGAVLFFLLQDSLADLGATYLIVLGVVAVLFTLYVPKGLWGLLSRGRVQLFPTGYRLLQDREKRR